MFIKIAIVGTGNIGSWLFKTLQNQKKLEVVSISSRKIETLPTNFDLYIFALKDDVYEEVLKQIPFKMPHAVHTSGSLSQNILAPYSENFGVLYPYQSIINAEKEKKERKKEKKSYDLMVLWSYGLIPICVEGSDYVFEDLLFHFAKTISNIVHKVNEKQRFAMHLAAVFANNFTNAMYSIAYQIFKENDLDWSLIFPLLENTLEKAKQNAPYIVQTGPAKRNDFSIMEKHCNNLQNKDIKKLYQLISKVIHSQNQSTNH